MFLRLFISYKKLIRRIYIKIPINCTKSQTLKMWLADTAWQTLKCQVTCRVYQEYKGWRLTVNKLLLYDLSISLLESPKLLDYSFKNCGSTCPRSSESFLHLNYKPPVYDIYILKTISLLGFLFTVGVAWGKLLIPFHLPWSLMGLRYCTNAHFMPGIGWLQHL